MMVQDHGSQRRKDILRAAVQTFSEWGFRGSTIRRLAAAANMSEALLYRYFSSKDELWDAVLEHLIESRRSSPLYFAPENEPDAIDDRSFLLRVADSARAHYDAHPEELRLLLFSSLQGHQLANRFFNQQVRPFFETLQKRLQAGQEEGRYRAIAPGAAAGVFMGMLHHQLLTRVLRLDSLVCGKENEWNNDFVEIFLDGIRTR